MPLFKVKGSTTG
ncbi:hypothetical protein EC07798_2711, partial [Escherichia coli 07798]